MSALRARTCAYPFALMCFLAVCGPGAIGVALGCSPGAINIRQLESGSDVIATGVIHIIEQTEERGNAETVIRGTAELRLGVQVKNRTSLAAPFVFAFEYIKAEGCIFGQLPEDGSTARVYLARSASQADILDLVHLEPIKKDD